MVYRYTAIKRDHLGEVYRNVRWSLVPRCDGAPLDASHAEMDAFVREVYADNPHVTIDEAKVHFLVFTLL